MIYVVLPAYNEAQNIAKLLQHVKRAMEDANLGYRVVVVNDGSTDDTAKTVSGLTATLPVELIENEVNMGLAETIKRGLIRAAELCTDDDDIIVTMDADNSHTPGLILRMVYAIREGNDVVIASRYRYGSKVRGVSFGRELLSLGASSLFRLVLPIDGVRDFTCGYRAYRAGLLKRAFREIGPDRIISERGFSCMVDILLQIRDYDPIMTEVPLILRYDKKLGQSKMKVAGTIKDTLALIVRRRLGI